MACMRTCACDRFSTDLWWFIVFVHREKSKMILLWCDYKFTCILIYVYVHMVMGERNEGKVRRKGQAKQEGRD